ncbi:unnamed protein product [Heligmosomoides polygyrus]|uniref:Uncharacterized protein n=1 Tax=Heligmosomoides polygyrus TaxID=6339 RepID=A0A183FWL1_HELPZ|nr:unnamed protein product [Heligmosomoides polygyrus]
MVRSEFLAAPGEALLPSDFVVITEGDNNEEGNGEFDCSFGDCSASMQPSMESIAKKIQTSILLKNVASL